MPTDDPVCRDPVSFVRAGRPLSANKTKGKIGEKIAADLKGLYKAAGGGHWNGFRYGVVYYFVRDYKPHNDSDADNVSKPIWDALEGEAYDDDKVVRLRRAGVIEIGASNGAPSLDVIDVTEMPATASDRFFHLLEQEERHIVYVELGAVTPDMFTFNLANRQRSA